MYLRNLNNIAVWMDGVNMSMPDNTITAFKINSCSNLTTYGPTLWWDVPGFGQATITAVTPLPNNVSEVQFHFDAGYDSSTLIVNGQLNAEYISPTTGRLHAGPGWSTFIGPASAVSGMSNTYSFNYTLADFVPLVGYKLLSRGKFLMCNRVENSNYTTINDFTLLNCGGFAFFSGFNRKTTFNSFTLKPADFPPPGGTELPARSGSADGIHSGYDFVGPTIDSSYFAALDDDCMAIHGSIANATNASGNKFAGSQSAFPGDVLRFYIGDSYVPLGTAKVISSSTTNVYASAVITVDQLPSGFVNGSAKYANQNRVGSGFAIRNTHTAGNRGRGAIVKASNGVIENNLFEGVAYDGIYLGPEFTDWSEADYVHNLTITNNIIRNCSYINKATAAFDLHGDKGTEAPSTTLGNPITGNSNITVSNLTISGTGSHGNLFIGAAENVRLEGVVIENALTQPGLLWEITRNALVNFENVQFTGQVGLCVRGTDQEAGVQPLKTYGQVYGAPTSLAQC